VEKGENMASKKATKKLKAGKKIEPKRPLTGGYSIQVGNPA